MSGPFEQAWMLLKNVMDYGEVASELSEPDPLGAALARARNQGPAPGVNLKPLPPATIQGMDSMMRRRKGETPLGKPVPPPIPKMPLGIERPKIAPQYANPLTGDQYVTDQTQELRDQKAEEAHLDRLQTDRDYLEQFM